ncbi:hypothetical protein OJF2_58240 [Aquisphaera giovannonii]|uniref:SEC-C motif protein n=1 Tax=Aquisphaera giovannonii TaxID=406548 RepID=A0A5B9W9X5_9BACT|nr:SEC-C domain-containing protein [Aquisphaera giovannonii]QEH37237.1 hypothetical protein OJF2_58240 [Aquisphaera giovannonii]
MALVDPYEPCPCGSGKKYKWCCQKAETYLERSIRLEDTAQADAVLAPIEEGLAKLPGNNMLLLRKATYLASLERDEEAVKALDIILSRDPANPAALDTLARLVLTEEGPTPIVARLQDALKSADAGARARLGELALMLGDALARHGDIPAALKHIELAAEITDRQEDLAAEARQILADYRRDPRFTPWLKQPLALSLPPDGLDPHAVETFNQALGWAKDGLWDSAAAAFELLSANPDAARVADRNLGICRLWLAEDAAATAALRRSIAGLPATTEAVDTAVLIELIDPATDPEPVEEVSLTWPIRDRHDLLARLKGNEAVAQEDTPPSEEPGDPDPDTVVFLLLDLPKPRDTEGLSPEKIPVARAEIAVGAESVRLVTFDDGRLNSVMDQFTSIAGTSVPPSHPKTKAIRRADRSEVATEWRWYLPPDLDEDEVRRLETERLVHFYRERWADIPQAVLGGKSPAQLAGAGNAEVPLRAAVLILEAANVGIPVDWAALRARLNIPAEPPIDPASVAIGEVPVGRLHLVPVEGLDDDRLVALDRLATTYGLTGTALACCKEIVRRGTPIANGKISPVATYTTLIGDAVRRGDREAAFQALADGRAASIAAGTAAAEAAWDLTQFQLSVRFEQPDTWVPLLVSLTERYKGDRGFTQVMSSLLVQMGLLRPVPVRDRPGEFAMDTRLLERLIGLYGPKVQAASDYLGISATKGGIWTPGGSEGKGGGAIWTPGSDATAPEQGGDKPRIILAR